MIIIKHFILRYHLSRIASWFQVMVLVIVVVVVAVAATVVVAVVVVVNVVVVVVRVVVVVVVVVVDVAVLVVFRQHFSLFVCWWAEHDLCVMYILACNKIRLNITNKPNKPC